MPRRLTSLFAGSGIGSISIKTTLHVVLAAFLAGFLVAWLTSLVPGWVNGPAASPEPEPEITYPGEVIVPQLQPVLRDLDAQDTLAGVTTTKYTYRGDGTFTTLPGKGEPKDNGVPVRWVSIAVEDGVEVDAQAFKEFVFKVLEDNRSWGSDGRLQFVQTDGVADYRFVLASPYTSAATCPNPQETVRVGPVMEATPDAEDTTGAPPDVPTLVAGDNSQPQRSCALDGIVPISLFEWTAGFSPFGGDRTAARTYLVNHRLGHLFGHEETFCVSGRALIMDDQRVPMVAECEVNPWPFPDAVASGMTPTSPTPSPAP